MDWFRHQTSYQAKGGRLYTEQAHMISHLFLEGSTWPLPNLVPPMHTDRRALRRRLQALLCCTSTKTIVKDRRHARIVSRETLSHFEAMGRNLELMKRLGLLALRPDLELALMFRPVSPCVPTPRPNLDSHVGEALT